MWIGQEILLVSPVVVLERLTGLVMETEFWRSIGFSLVRILGGFFLAAAAGILAAGLSAKFERIREFLLLRYGGQGSAGGVLYYSCAHLGAIPEFVGSDFIFDGISYSLHECVGRYSQYGS